MKLILLCALVACSKSSSAPIPRDGTIDLEVSVLRNADGTAAVSVYIPASAENASVTVAGKPLGRLEPTSNNRYHGYITLQRSELKPGKAEYTVTAERKGFTHLVGTKTFAFDNYAIPTIVWETKGDVFFHTGNGLEITAPIGAKLDANTVATITGTAPPATKLTAGGAPVAIDPSGKFTVAIDLAMKDGPIDGDGPSTTLVFAEGGDMKLWIERKRALDVILARGKPLVFDGEAASTTHRTLYNTYDLAPAKRYGTIAKLSDIDLVAIEQHENHKLSNCTYGRGYVVTREEEVVTVTVRERRTGKQIAKRVFASKYGTACPSEIRANPSNGGSDWFQKPERADIDAWIATQIAP